MISHYEITHDEWTQITNTGESGTCWVALNTLKGGGMCALFHDATQVPSDDDLKYAYPVYEPRGQNKREVITADNTNDIFYARMTKVGGSCTLVVDVV